MAPYRLARALETLRDDINKAVPVRNRQSDGWIGDAAHASRSSDHNPWVRDGNTGIVTAIDITNDPGHGVDGSKLSEALIKDPRVKYVIFNRRIWNPSVSKSWRPYKGTNPHDHHVHVSILSDKTDYDDPKHWNTGLAEQAPSDLKDTVPPPAHSILKLGSQGGEVAGLQRRLGIDVDADFGPKTERAVKSFQKTRGIKQDGIVGPYTWDLLEKYTKDVAKQSFVGTNTGVVPPPIGDVPAEYGSPEWAINYFKEKGWNEAAAIALVANLMWESGGNTKINWGAKGDKGKDGNYHSFGAGQWNDRHGRAQNLQRMSEEQGVEVTDPKLQLDYLDKELRTTERFVGNKLQGDIELDDAVDDALGFWRPSVPHQDRREAIAKKLWSKYHAS